MFVCTGSGLARAIMEEIVSYLEPIGTDTIIAGGSQADTAPWLQDDVPLATLHQDDSKYFFFHHTHGMLYMYCYTMLYKSDLNEQVMI